MHISTITKTGTENWQRYKLRSAVFISFVFMWKVKGGYAIYLLASQESECLAHSSFLQPKKKKKNQCSQKFFPCPTSVYSEFKDSLVSSYLVNDGSQGCIYHHDPIFQGFHYVVRSIHSSQLLFKVLP